MTTRQRSSEGRQLKASESMEEVESPITGRGHTDTTAIRRARNRLAARKSRQKRAEKNEELVEQVTRLEEQVQYWRGVALQHEQGNELGDGRMPVAANARTESPEEDLEEEEERLRKELDHLRRKNRVMDLRRQVADARRLSESAGEERGSGNNHIMPERSYRQSTSLRSSDDDDRKPKVAAKRRRTEDPALASIATQRYHGQTSTEYIAFTQACEQFFESRSVEYRHDEEKIDYALERLPNDLQAAWRRETTRHRSTWNSFKNFLLDELEPSFSNVSPNYFRARQGKDQTVGDFVLYLCGLEGQLGPFTDTQRRDQVLHSLRPEISDAIHEEPELPPTLSELVDLAIAIENKNKRQQQLAPQTHANGRSGNTANRSANKLGPTTSRSYSRNSK